MDDQLEFTRDVINKDFLIIDSSLTVEQAINILGSSITQYGIVVTVTGVPIRLITRGILTLYPDLSARLDSLPETPAIVVSGDIRVNVILAYLSRTIYEYAEIEGLIVEDEAGKIAGVLPIQTLSSLALKLASDERGFEGIELAGNPQIPPQYFVCPKDPEHLKKLVMRYDPDDPPTCPTHYILLVRRS